MQPAGSWLVALAAAVLLGAAIWAASPFVVGQAEPWDAERGLAFFYYPAALLAAGFICGVAARRRAAAAYCGLLVGQLAFMFVTLPKDPLMVLGFVFLALYSTLSIIGAWLAELVITLRIRQQLPAGEQRGPEGA